MSLKNNLCKNIEYIVDSFLNQKINIRTDNPILEGILIKPEKKTESIIFIDSKGKNSIRCYFINNETFSIEKNEKVKITNSRLDLLLVERGIKFIESNIILIIEKFEITKEDLTEINIPLNINRITDIKNKVMSKLDEHIKLLLNKYYTLELSNEIKAENFIGEKNQKKQINMSIFKIFQKILKISEKGVLLNENRGLKSPFKYMISPNDNDFDLTNNLLAQVNWKNLYNNMPTVNENKNNNLNAEKIEIRNLKIKNEMEKAKKEFLKKKVKRCEINEDEKKNMSKKLNDLIDDYGNIHVNIGQSLINKYYLYKKYMKLIHTEKIK